MADRTVRVRLEAITGQYEAAMAKAGLTTRGLAKEAALTGDVGAGSFKKMALGMFETQGGALAAAAGVAIAGAAVLKFTRDGIDSYVHLVDEVRAYKNVTGASAEESSKMVAVAHALGVSTDTLAGGMFRLNHNLVANGDALKASGVEIAHNKDGSVDLTGTLLSLADAYQAVGGGSRGAELARQAFGRGGLALVPILKQSRGALKEFWDEAERHHEIVTDSDLKAVFQFHVETRALDEAWTGLERQMGAAVLPTLTHLAVTLTDLIDKADGLAQSVGGWGNLFKSALESVPGVGLLATGLDLLSGGQSDAEKAAEKHAAAEQKLADTLAADKKEVDDFTKALSDLAAQQFSVQEAGDKVESSLIDFADATRAAQIGGDKWATSLQAGSIQGNRNREALIGMTKGALDVAKAMKEQHASQDQINVAMVVYRERLIDTLGQLGFNRQEVGSYVDTLLQIPGNLGTVITADTAQAEQALARVLSILGAIQRAESFTNLNVLSGRTVAPPVDTGGGTTLNDAINGRGPQATQARTAAAGAGRSAADDAKAAHDAYLSAEDEFERNMYDHHLRTLAEYQAYLDGRMKQETQFSAGWFTLLDERQRVEQQAADDQKTWRDAVARNDADAAKRWMDTARDQYETGDLTRQQYRQILVARLGDLDKFSADYMDVWNQIRQIDEQNLADQQQTLQRLQQAADQAVQRRTDAFSRLTSLLDDESKLRKQQQDLAETHRKKMADIETGFVDDQAKILDARRTQLDGWARIDQRVFAGWGNTVSSLSANVQEQISMFGEWTDQLAAARARGLSEDVISLLGLGEGPQALGQLRMFSSATQTEIDQLNAAVEQRQRQVGDRVSDEAKSSTSKVAAMLKDLAEKHAAAVEQLTEDFLAQERDLSTQLAQLGLDTGRSYGDAIADGLNSSIPGIRAAAEAAAAAVAAASSAVKDSNVRAHNPGNLKDIVGGKSGTSLQSATLAPVVNVGVMVGNKVITDLVKITTTGWATSAAIAGVR